MKAALRRALSIAHDVDNFRWGSVDSDPDAIFYGTQLLRELAIRLRAATQSFNYPELRNALQRLQLDLDGSDFGASVALHAELLGISGLIRDAAEDWGDDPTRWAFSQNVANGGLQSSGDEPRQNVEAAAMHKAQLLERRCAELESEIERLKEELAADPRRLPSYQKIVLGLAVRDYGYRPSDARNPAANKIALRLGQGRLHISDDTVRRCLRNAAEDLGFDEAEIDEFDAGLR